MGKWVHTRLAGSGGNETIDVLAENRISVWTWTSDKGCTANKHATVQLGSLQIPVYSGTEPVSCDAKLTLTAWAMMLSKHTFNPDYRFPEHDMLPSQNQFIKILKLPSSLRAT